MYLNIILTILVLILLTIFLSMYLWWRRFGKKMFDSMSSMNKILPKDTNKMFNPNDMGNMFSEVHKMMNQINNLKKK